MWNLGKVPSISTLHKTFYGELGRLGFRAHHVKQIYVYARAVVKAVKRNDGRKPVLRKLSVRIDKYDYRLDSDNMLLVLRIHGGREVKLKLLAPEVRIEKFKRWSNYEVAVKTVDSEVYVSIYFRKSVKPRKHKTVMAVDVNFDNITVTVFAPSGELLKLKRFKTPLRRILAHRIRVERIQRKYSKSWRFIKGVKVAIEKHGERIRNVVWDFAHKLGNRVAELASKHSSIIVFRET